MANGDENKRDFTAEIAGAREVIDLTKFYIKLEKDRSESLSANLKIQRSLVKALEEQADETEKIFDGTSRLEDAKKKQIESETLLKKLIQEKKVLALQGFKADSGIQQELQKQVNNAFKLNKARQAGVKTIQDSSNVATKSLNFIESSAGVLQKNLRLPAGFTKGIGGMAKGARAAAVAGKGLGGSLMGAFKALRLNPFGLILTAVIGLVKALISANNKITALAKGLGVSKNEARAINRRINETAMSSDNLLNTSKEIGKAFSDINSFLGTSSTVISGELLDGVATLQNRLGLTKESAMGFAQASLLSGESVNQIKLNAIGAAKATEEEFGTRVDIRGVLEEAGKTTGLIRANLGANPAAIAKAAASAKLLGTNLKDVAAAGKQLLNFEESINNELSAELLTGKQINLERARLAALTGDQETLGKELLAQVGDFNDFSKMNVIQQEALAKSIGMQGDQLADILLKQGNIAELKEKARREGDKETEAQLEQLSTQQKFNAAIEKLKDFVVILVDRLESGTSIFGALFKGFDTTDDTVKTSSRENERSRTELATLEAIERQNRLLERGMNVTTVTQFDGFASRDGSAVDGVAQNSIKLSTGMS